MISTYEEDSLSGLTIRRRGLRGWDCAEAPPPVLPTPVLQLFFPASLAPALALLKMAADSEVRCLFHTYPCLYLSSILRVSAQALNSFLSSPSRSPSPRCLRSRTSPLPQNGKGKVVCLVTNTLGPGVSPVTPLTEPTGDATYAGKVKSLAARVSASSLLGSAAGFFRISWLTSPGPSPFSQTPETPALRSFVFSAQGPLSLDLWFSSCCPSAETVVEAITSV